MGTPRNDDERILVLGLDGYEHSVAETLIAAGQMPHLARLEADAAVLGLEHGKDVFAGISWEQFSTGKTCDAMRQWAAVTFDPATYRVRQRTSTEPPFLGRFGERVVVFDPPYFDLSRAPGVQGVVNWGAHDPGVPSGACPAPLFSELVERFGEYPAKDCIYGFHWPSPEHCRHAGAALAGALEVRRDVVRWLLTDRLPDWDLAFTVVSELHSVIEPLWHGVDVSHPLHDHASAPDAREAIHRVYRALDGLIGMLRETFPQATLVIFSMHGMGPNTADVPSMLLLPEFCFRRSFGRPLFKPRESWVTSLAAGRPPAMGPNEFWPAAVNSCLDLRSSDNTPAPAVDDDATPRSWRERIGSRVRQALGRGPSLSKDPPSRAARMRASNTVDPVDRSEGGPEIDLSLSWMPAARYQPFWRDMDGFAVPAYYLGRIRINLEGREAAGRVTFDKYQSFCDQLERDLLDCRDAVTGEPVIAAVERCAFHDAMQLHGTQCDLEVQWSRVCFAIRHPRLGLIGPAPIRRTAGHLGHSGVCFIVNGPLAPGPHGDRSVFDIAPTIIDLLGDCGARSLSGNSILSTEAAS